MGSFQEFVRYALPGYMFVGSVLFCLAIAGVLPADYQAYERFAGIVGATILVVGPLLGFIIHQIYFVYFDWRESYTKLTRGCIAFIFNAFLESDTYKENPVDKTLVRDQSFVAWKFLTTNFQDDFKIDELFITRLRSLRNFSHSFGSIILSSILSLLSATAVWIPAFRRPSPICLFFGLHLLLISLFYSKRREVLHRINELEVGIVLLNKQVFIDYLEKLMRLECENKKILSAIRR